MLDNIVHFYDHLPLLIKLPVWFFINVILVRGIIAQDIESWIKSRGILKDGIIGPTLLFLKRLFFNTERKLAILAHYRSDHPNKLNACYEGKCSSL